MERKVSVQLARKPEPAAPAAEAGEGGEGTKRRNSTRGRGRTGRGRGGRAARGGRGKKDGEVEGEVEATTNGSAPLATATNETATTDAAAGEAKGERAPRKQRGPPEDGVPSKTKIMVANLPYDLGEEKVSPR